jgi:hypothetical protein
MIRTLIADDPYPYCGYPYPCSNYSGGAQVTAALERLTPFFRLYREYLAEYDARDALYREVKPAIRPGPAARRWRGAARVWLWRRSAAARLANRAAAIDSDAIGRRVQVVRRPLRCVGPYAGVCACACACARVCVCVYVYVCTCIFIYIYTYYS